MPWLAPSVPIGTPIEEVLRDSRVTLVKSPDSQWTFMCPIPIYSDRDGAMGEETSYFRYWKRISVNTLTLLQAPFFLDCVYSEFHNVKDWELCMPDCKGWTKWAMLHPRTRTEKYQTPWLTGYLHFFSSTSRPVFGWTEDELSNFQA